MASVRQNGRNIATNPAVGYKQDAPSGDGVIDCNRRIIGACNRNCDSSLIGITVGILNFINKRDGGAFASLT